jgi:D-beta-D-heptose 7-phosphate kinase/D-beta-D-heptose 1-phosphate adenosyltransferase
MNHSTLTQLVAAFAGKHVVIVGDVMLDEYVWGRVRRISPEAPVPVVEVEQRTYRPGGAANTAANVLGLGGRALLGSVAGVDRAGEQLRDLLLAQGAEAHGLLGDPGRRTTTKTRVVAHSQQVVRLDDEHRTTLPAALEDQLLGWAEAQQSRADVFLLSDYAKGVVTPRLAGRFIQLARQAGKPVLVDPKGTDFLKYRGATVLKPNLHEVERFLNRELHGESDVLEAGARLLEVLPGSAVLVTRGAQGMTLFREGRPPVHVASAARSVFDVTGAGDTVAGTLALALAAGAPLEQAAAVAARAAGIVVGKVGTAHVTPAELLDTGD